MPADKPEDVRYHVVGQYDPLKYVVSPSCVGMTLKKSIPFGSPVRIECGVPVKVCDLGRRFWRIFSVPSYDGRLWNYVEMDPDSVVKGLSRRSKHIKVVAPDPLASTKQVLIPVGVGSLWESDGKVIRVEDIEGDGLDARVKVSVFCDGGKKRRAVSLSVRHLVQKYLPLF